MIEKDNETVHSIVKQLDELHEQRRLLRNALYGMSIDQSDDSESNDSIQ
jgi:single-stranded DNA-specific DHH superfamily exonuclease